MTHTGKRGGREREREFNKFSPILMVISGLPSLALTVLLFCLVSESVYVCLEAAFTRVKRWTAGHHVVFLKVFLSGMWKQTVFRYHANQTC